MIKSWFFTLFIISALISPSMAQGILLCEYFPQGYINTVHQGMTILLAVLSPCYFLVKRKRVADSCLFLPGAKNVEELLLWGLQILLDLNLNLGWVFLFFVFSSLMLSPLAKRLFSYWMVILFHGGLWEGKEMEEMAMDYQEPGPNTYSRSG